MASRANTPVQQTQVRDSVALPIMLLGAGAAAPTLAGGGVSYFTITRTSAGVYVLTTKDKWARCIKVDVAFIPATAGATKIAQASGLTQNANKTWTVTVNFFLVATATDLAVGDFGSMDLVFSNVLATP
jgi:hypothetical protein